MKYKTFRVSGSVNVDVEMEIEIEYDPDDEEFEGLEESDIIEELKEKAKRQAEDDFPGLTNYCGNGGTDQLVGVNNRSISLNADRDYRAEFKYVEDITNEN